jgi:CubicO group peptidase (beta-lactamase class C family)
MTCTAAMQLVERGVIGLDDPVSKYLPDFADCFLLKDGQKVRPEKTMTVRHLFTMSAGFDYDRATKPILDTIAADPHATTLDIVKALVRSPLQFEPGTQFLYSMCHDVLAAVVEVASGMRFSDFLAENIWKPLGLTDTNFQITQEVMDRMSAQYICYEKGKIRPYKNYRDFNLTDRFESGGAGLYSTVNDYSLFADALACGGVGATGNRILKPETIDLMRTEQLSAIIPNPEVFTCWTGPGYGYGLGVRTMVDNSAGQRSPNGEFGWDGATGTFTLMDPANKLSLFFAMHVRGWTRYFPDCHIPIRDLTYQCLNL